MAHKHKQAAHGHGGGYKKRPSIGSGVRSQAQSVLRTGQRFDKFDQIRQRHFWSSYCFVPNANGYVIAGRYTLFTTPVGANGQGLPAGFVVSERESNWKSQNRVPDNQNFEISELGLSLMPADFLHPELAYALRFQVPSAISNFFQSTALSITYLTNSVPLGLLSDFAQASAPVQGINSLATAAVVGPPASISFAHPPLNPANYTISNGFAAPALRRKYKIPILLQHGESFNFTLEVPRNTYVGNNAQNVIPFLVRMDFFATESFVEKS